MSFITFQCYACQQVLKVGDDKAGRKAKCYKCGTVLTIPVASTVPSGPPSSSTKLPPPLPQGNVPPPARPSQTPMPPGVIMAEVIEPGPPPARPQRPPVAEVAEVADEADAYEEEERPRRRRPRDDEDEYDDEEYEDRPRPKVSQASRWRKVRLGLLLMFIGACVYAGGYGLGEVGVLIQFLTGFSQPRTLDGMRGVTQAYDAARVVYRIGLFILFGGVVTSIVGYVFGLFAPNKYASLGLSIATLATAGVGALLMIPFRLAGRPYFGGSESHWLDGSALAGLFFGPSEQIFLLHSSPASFIVSLLVDGCVLASFILVPLYLRALARAKKDRFLAEDCMRLMTYSCCAIGFSLLWPLLTLPFRTTSLETARAAFWVTWILYFINVGLFVGMLVWFLRTLAQARAAFER